MIQSLSIRHDDPLCFDMAKYDIKPYPHDKLSSPKVRKAEVDGRLVMK